MSDTLKSYRVRIKSNIGKNWAIYTLFLIIILASFLRLYNLDNLNVIEDTEANKIIGMLHVWDTSLGNIFAHFLQSIPFGVAITELLLSLSAHFLGFSIFSVRLPIAIIGVLIVISVYFLGKELYDERVGLLSAFLLAISPLHIWYTRMIIHHNVTALFIILALYFFIKNEHSTKTYQGKRDWITKNKYLLLTVLMIWLGCCNEEPILGVLPVFLLYLLFTQRLSWVKRKELWVGLIIFLLPILIFSGTFIGTIQSQHPLQRGDWQYFYDLVSHGDFTAWKDYIIYWSLARFELVPFYRFHLPIISFLVFLSILWLIIRHKGSELYLLFSIAIYGVFFTLYPEKHEYYMVHYIPLISVALGGFITHIASLSESAKKLHAIKSISATLLVIGIIATIPIIYSVETSNPTSLRYGALSGHQTLFPRNPETMQRAYAYGHGMEEVANEIIKESKEKNIMIGNIIVDVSKPLYIYLYEASTESKKLFFHDWGLYGGWNVIHPWFPKRMNDIVNLEEEWLCKENSTILWIIPANYDSFERNILFKIHPDIKLIKTVSHKKIPYFYVYRILSAKKQGIDQEFYDIYNTKPKIRHPVEVNYSNKISLLGYNLSYNEQDPAFHITYYWKSVKKVNKDYISFVHFTTQDGKLVFQQDHPIAYGFYETSNWNPGEIIKEDYWVVVPSYVPPGTYDIRVGLWYPQTGKKLSIINKEVSNSEDRAIIGSIEVLPKND